MTILLTILLLTQAPTDPKIPVHVTTAATAGGFTDPSKDRQDSAKDLAGHVKSSKLLRLAPATAAALTLEIVERRAVFGATNFERTLVVRLTAGQYSTELSDMSIVGFKDAAKRIASQVETWARENRAKLAALTK